MEINKIYDAKDIEQKWYNYWNENGFFKPEAISSTQKPFTVLIPPPNVTGILHIGHVLNNTLQDVAIRFNRMKQRPTLWIPGTDHAGIATQNMVEKELAKENKTRHDIGREALVNRIWEWKQEKGSHIIDQLKQLGCSCDWSREVYTMDENLTEAVKEVFIHLYEKDLIYKAKYIINWCPRCVTALANDEVEHEDKKGKLWYIKYPLTGTENLEFLIIATTRPETMLGDVAVAVNPKDVRYSHLIGKTVLLPISNREIPIIADDYVNKEFGTGCVKVTPAHDPNDFEIGLRHNLEQLIIMDIHGCINENAPIEYQGLDRYKARKKILEQLTDLNLIEKIEEHENSVGQCYRCDTVIEPYLSDQWFVRMKPLAKRAIDVVESGEIKFYPERWTKVYMHWMNNIRDWCISRQIWWGHRIPAYYCESCDNMIVSKSLPTICINCNCKSFKQDDDVLDTWFSSWLWPFSTMGWPKSTKDLDTYLPTNLLITAPEIIYLWVARMIMATLEFKDMIPFDTVLLHGIVRDSKGRKMSKSLGNSPDPIDLINKVGADALRFSIVFNNPKGQDSYFSEDILETGRNFTNKIWNAFRFIMMNVTDNSNAQISSNLADKWIYSLLNRVIKDVTDHYENLRYNDAAHLLMNFIWDNFCSWYIEMSKESLNKEVLLDVMQTSMRLLHPIMPFITEEIWQTIYANKQKDEKALIIAKFPEADEKIIDNQINTDMEMIQQTIVAIRNIRKQLNISPAVNINIKLKLSNESQNELFTKYQGYINKLAKVDDVVMGCDLPKPVSSMIAVVNDIKIYVPLEGLINIEEEKAKLIKQKDKLDKELQIIQSKLKNENFINNAKPEIIEKEKERELDVVKKLNSVLEVLDDM